MRTEKRARSLFLGSMALSLGLLTLAPTPLAANPLPPSEGVPAFGHVFVIVGENAELGNVNKSNSPYLIGTFEPKAAWHTNYFALAHNSLANYIGMTSGQFITCDQNDDPPSTCHQDVPNLFNQMDTAGVSWKSWMESMPKPCDLRPDTGTLKGSNTYRTKHNPAIYYDGVEGAGGLWSRTNKSAECLANDVPAGTTASNDMSYFNEAVKAGNVPQFNYIVPNQCEDAHDNCKPTGNPLTQFDDFLAREVPRIEASPAFGSDGVIVVLFDEGAGDNIKNHQDKFGQGGRVVFAVESPLAVPGTYTGVFDHYSFLRTLEDGFGLFGYVGHAAQANPINNIWG